MNTLDPIIFRQLPMIQKIIDDETWLEGERRGCPVSPSDSTVRARVCEIVLRIGQELRESALRLAPAVVTIGPENIASWPVAPSSETTAA